MPNPAAIKQPLGKLVRTKSDTGFGFWGNPLFVPILIFLWFGLLLVFRLNPQFDLDMLSIFYDPTFCENAANPAKCVGFPLSKNEILNLVRDILHLAPNFSGVVLIVLLSIRYWGGTRWSSQSFRNQSVVLATLLLGPLLIVNSFFKEGFGRVRPRSVEEFGGAMEFTLPGDIVGQCLSNCSFVSGEASVGGWFLVCGLLFSTQYRRSAYFVLFVLGFFMAILRVTFGAHFLSDVILGYLVPIIVCAILASTIAYFGKQASATNS